MLKLKFAIFLIGVFEQHFQGIPWNYEIKILVMVLIIWDHIPKYLSDLYKKFNNLSKGANLRKYFSKNIITYFSIFWFLWTFSFQLSIFLEPEQNYNIFFLTLWKAFWKFVILYISKDKKILKLSHTLSHLGFLLFE